MCGNLMTNQVTMFSQANSMTHLLTEYGVLKQTHRLTHHPNCKKQTYHTTI